MRGRNNGGGGNNNNNNNNRKGPNPLTRNYESNGPDVKIRGSAQQIAEKYATLARDAQSSGDRVMAENYLQHAEHYNRIIAAAQAQMPIQQVQAQRDDLDDEDGEENYGFESNSNNGSANGDNYAPAPNQQTAAPGGSGPQPVIEGMPAEVALNPEAAGQQGHRHRDRRPHGEPRQHNQNQNEQSTEPRGEGDQPLEAGEEPLQARRGRRPRRGDRNRDFNGDRPEQPQLAEVEPAPAAEMSDGAKALAAFEN